MALAKRYLIAYESCHITTDELTKCVFYLCLDDLKDLNMT